MKTKEWIAVIIAIIVVAVIVSLITVNLTGNVIKLNQDRFGKYQVYTTSEIDTKLGNVTTNQGVLNMLRTDSSGRCGFNEEPTESLWDELDDDYLTYTKPYIDADTNRDGITTGTEWCGFLGGTCVTGHRLSWLSIQNFSNFVMNNPIGCAGGSSVEDLRMDRPTHNIYVCCKA